MERKASHPFHAYVQSPSPALRTLTNSHSVKGLSSEMFPFASHPEYGYDLSYADEELKSVGALINKYGHRVTTHPGQFTQLGSPRKEVIKTSARDRGTHRGYGFASTALYHNGVPDLGVRSVESWPEKKDEKQQRLRRNHKPLWRPFPRHA